MRVAIAGSRSYNNYEELEKFVLKTISLKDIGLVITGKDVGTDTLAEKFADKFNLNKLIFELDPADEESARTMKHIKIINNSDIVIIFWDNKSKGTEELINFSKEFKKSHHICMFK